MLTNLNINLVDASDGLLPKPSAVMDRLRGTLVGHGVAMGSCAAYSVVMVPRWSSASRRPCGGRTATVPEACRGDPFPCDRRRFGLACEVRAARGYVIRREA